MKIAILIAAALAVLLVVAGLWVANRPGAYSGDYGNSMFGLMIAVLGALIGCGDLLMALGWLIFR